ncbi:hypothetical protein TVAG_103980 [Trichomonas vaginalis G3]|uniref:Uncharacterized protein n=1 Tax=Trichomonas vaginalis (strain ATCC PRA-98 / G3) TaxID=412133 RepID=A2FN37_TRIV3|nr:hypothetical protein TVAGG3_0043980 [Trichomonas vaginalis G3]EAX93679.1 hypothetical protein TVAG_103980 [Trichomonas vaginalis G3]KAI5540900.1 hypothetical protein TVAGG3_0043980 [Trichomonas vaginalis G3]|eukprot:XP_001306609.1 hypothetical protein [Trichomonas vaginalis G3]
MRINFDLRNELTLIRRNPTYNQQQLQQRKDNIETFMKYFNKVKQYPHKDLQEVKITIEDDIKILTEKNKLTEEMKSNTQTRQSLQTAINDLEKSIEAHDNEFQKIMKTLNSTIASSSSKAIQLQNSIDDLTPCINSLKIRVDEKEAKKQELLSVLDSKRQQLSEIRNINDQSHERRSEIKTKLRTKLGKLTATYHRLLDDEKPLIKALEDVEAQLSKIKDESKIEIEKYNSESTELLTTIQEIDSKITEVKSVHTSNQSSRSDFQRTIKLNHQIHENSLTEQKKLRTKIDKINISIEKLLQNSKTIEDEIKITKDSRENVSNQIKLRTEQIEQLRQENNRLASLIRVHQENIQNEESQNQAIKSELTTIQTELHSSREECDIHTDKIELVRKTLSAFSSLQDAMLLNGVMSPLGVASRAIEFIRLSRQKLEDDEPPTRITSRMVKEEIEELNHSISIIDEKLNN